MTEFTVAGVEVKGASESIKRVNGLVWGDAGCGKTTLAATLPGKKLWLQFDQDGADSVAFVPDVDIADFSGSSPSITAQFKNEANPLGLKDAMEKYDTFIFDSITNIVDKTLMKGIADTTNATVERPSPAAFGTRNALAIRLIKNVMRLTRMHNKNVFFIAHEGAPTTDKEGTVMHISLALGGQLPSNLGIDFSEFWGMYQTDSSRERRIAIRPIRKRKPMKTRMFRQDGEGEFEWKFNADDWDNPKNEPHRFDTWFGMWSHFNEKLPLPDTKEFMKLFDRWKEETKV